VRRLIYSLRIQVASDKRKASALAALMLVLVVLGVKQADLALPSSATAEPGDGSGLAGLVTESSLDELGFRGPIIRAPRPEPTERDLFRLDPAFFPKPSQTAPSDPEPPKSAARPAEVPVDTGLAERALRERVLSESAALRLKSVMMGRQPIAVIQSNAGARPETVMLRPGETVNGFELIEVKANTVVLEKQGVTIELTR